MSMTAQSVADMEHELQLAHATIAELQERMIKAELERDSLRDQLALAQDERDDATRLATQIETILEHTSMGLVQGVAKLREDRNTRRRRRNEIFEAALAAGETVPLFLRNQMRGRAAATDRLVREATGTVSGRTPAQAPDERGSLPKPPAAKPAPDLESMGRRHETNGNGTGQADPRLPPASYDNDAMPQGAANEQDERLRELEEAITGKWRAPVAMREPS